MSLALYAVSMAALSRDGQHLYTRAGSAIAHSKEEAEGLAIDYMSSDPFFSNTVHHCVSASLIVNEQIMSAARLIGLVEA